MILHAQTKGSSCSVSQIFRQMFVVHGDVSEMLKKLPELFEERGTVLHRLKTQSTRLFS